MKKKLILIFIFFILTGCSIKIIPDNSFDEMVETVLYQDTKLVNSNFEGFSFYLPRGTTIQNKKNDNIKITYKNNDYYLYVDTIAYYYKTKKEHQIDNNLFYSKNLSYKNNSGYIDISKVQDKYFIEFMYNYAKIETYVENDSLGDSFLNICYILSTIKFNDSTINYKLNNQKLEYSSEEFDIFKSKKDSDNFLQYIEEFDKYETNDKTLDNDIIETEDN